MRYCKEILGICPRPVNRNRIRISLPEYRKGLDYCYVDNCPLRLYSTVKVSGKSNEHLTFESLLVFERSINTCFYF
jgi:hypothetical protein